MTLNERAHAIADELTAECDAYRVAPVTLSQGTRVIDCGVQVTGGLEAGKKLAEICLAGLGSVQLTPAAQPSSGVQVSVRTDQPVTACMASQYAGWQITGDNFFAMGSGPMRAAYGREELFQDIGHLEDSPPVAVGVLESRQLPGDDVASSIAESCGVPAERLTLLIAPTASLAGCIQVVARSVETAMHKLHELGFDLARVVSGHGVAPLPPLPKDDLAGIGVTNDAVLYGGEVTLWVRGDDASLQAVGPQVPSCASSDYGEPFLQLFENYDRDFYKIDPLLFSPAVVRFNNVETGSVCEFGRRDDGLLARSFGVT